MRLKLIGALKDVALVSEVRAKAYIYNATCCIVIVFILIVGLRLTYVLAELALVKDKANIRLLLVPLLN